MLKSSKIAVSIATVLGSLLMPLVARSDSTAELLFSLNCKDYKVQIWQNRSSGDYLYRAQGFTGDLSLNKGTRQKTEGVTVYKFRNKNYEYWVWDGTLDSSSQGVLELYGNGKQIINRTCTKE